MRNELYLCSTCFCSDYRYRVLRIGHDKYLCIPCFENKDKVMEGEEINESGLFDEERFNEEVVTHD